MKIINQVREITEAQDKKAERNRGEWVFPNPTNRTEHVREVQKLAQRVRRNSAVSYRAHDLRRTAASMMAGMGVPRLVIGKILNHVESGVTRVYDRHGYDREKQEALNAWGSRLSRIVSDLELVVLKNSEAGRHPIAELGFVWHHQYNCMVEANT